MSWYWYAATSSSRLYVPMPTSKSRKLFSSLGSEVTGIEAVFLLGLKTSEPIAEASRKEESREELLSSAATGDVDMATRNRNNMRVEFFIATTTTEHNQKN